MGHANQWAKGAMMMIAQISIDLPAFRLDEILTVIAIASAVIPVLIALLVWVLSRRFVPWKAHFSHVRKTEEVHKKHLELIEACRNQGVQNDAKGHEFLRELKNLSEGLREHRQVTKDNTTAMSRLFERLAVVEDRQNRKDEKRNYNPHRNRPYRMRHQQTGAASSGQHDSDRGSD